MARNPDADGFDVNYFRQLPPVRNYRWFAAAKEALRKHMQKSKVPNLVLRNDGTEMPWMFHRGPKTTDYEIKDGKQWWFMWQEFIPQL